MKIISVKKGFTADHSSTSYEFAAVDKPLTKEQINKVASLSRRADPDSRRVHFMYNVDGYDIPGGSEKLMEQYYDVMHMESYDWWTFSIALNVTEKKKNQIYRYEFDGEEDNLCISIHEAGERVVISIHCVLDMDEMYNFVSPFDNKSHTTDDELLNLLIYIREMIIDDNYDALYAVVKKYGSEDDLKCIDPPKDPDSEIIKVISSLLDTL